MILQHGEKERRRERERAGEREKEREGEKEGERDIEREERERDSVSERGVHACAWTMLNATETNSPET